MISETNATKKCAWVSPGSVGSSTGSQGFIPHASSQKCLSLERFCAAEQVGDGKQRNAVLSHVPIICSSWDQGTGYVRVQDRTSSHMRRAGPLTSTLQPLNAHELEIFPAFWG